MVTNPNFWEGKKVFLTGHTGFKGSWLTVWLNEMGAKVTGYSVDIPTKPSLFEEADLEDKIHHIQGDVRDYEFLLSFIKEAEPDVLIHMAAQPLVRLSYKIPRETYETNVMGTVNVLEAVRQVPSIKSTVIVTTDKCYENREWVYGYREIDLDKFLKTGDRQDFIEVLPNDTVVIPQTFGSYLLSYSGTVTSILNIVYLFALSQNYLGN